MAKTKISEFSATPGNNTDIDGINIAEGCAPSGINDAIRELMSQLKDFQTGAAGDSFNGPVGTTTAAAGAFTTLSASSTVSGTGFSTYLASPPAIGGTAAAAGSFTTLSASSTVTLSGGTANGVLYLNGSKVATSGSALTFDGTNLSLTTANAIYKVPNAGGSLFDAGGNNGFYIQGTPTAYLGFYAGGNEQMRLTSTGLGIGTSSPSAKLTITGTGATGYTSLLANGTTTAYNLWRLSNTGGDLRIGIESSTAVGILTGSTNYSSCIGTLTATNLHLGTNSTVQATIDSSGNLGLGVTPSAWGGLAANGVFQMYGGALYTPPTGGQDTIGMSSNTYYNGTNWIYKATSNATRYEQYAGIHRWFNAASGTAGNAITFTQAMTLSAAGGLSVGTTTDPGAGQILTTGNISIATNGTSFQWTNSGNNVAINAASGVLAFYTGTSSYTERARITSGGNLLIGGTTDSGGILQAYGSYSRFSDGTYTGYLGKASTIVTGGGTTQLALRSDDAILFAAAGATERARIDSSGNLLVGKSATGLGTAGIEMSSGGFGQFTVNNDASLFANRLGSDGDVVKFYRATSLVGSISVTTTTTAYNTSSDYRLKTLIAPVTDAGARIDALEPVEYEWKADGQRARGFFAHKFQEVYPGSVTGAKDAVDENGKPIYQAMQAGTSEVIADLVAELQSLRKRVAQLEKGN